MRILFVLPEFYPHPGGGIATYYQNLIPQLAKAGISCEVLIGSGFSMGNPDTRFKEIPVSYLHTGLFKKYLQEFKKLDLFPEIQQHLASAWAMYEQAKQGENFDIIETVDWGLGYLPWGLQSKKTVVTRLHGSCAQIETYDPRSNLAFWGDLLRLIERMTLPLSSKLITYSTNNQIFWQEILNQEVDYIPPIYELPLEKIQHPETSITTPENYALAIGRIQFWKGPEVLCKAIQEAKIDLPILWVGRDSDYQHKGNSFHQYLKEKYPGIWGDRIIPIGAKPYPEVLSLMNRAKFGIVCSTWDMFNFTALEWMSLGKPLLCSDKAGAWDLIEKAQCGMVFDPNAPSQLADFLQVYSAASDEFLDHTGKKGALYAKSYLALELLVESNLKRYQELVSTPKPKDQLTDPWLFELVCPSKEDSNRNSTLSYWPIRELVAHLRDRVFQKLNL